ncbi:MAG TPA: hypothetical protein VN894_14230, partial [Polyangiaceae bacterium]|nr:hypothetical protein [Polyangiaceae bacterium]
MTLHAAVDGIERLYEIARERLRGRIVRDGRVNPAALDRNQLAAHALAYVATDLAACRELVDWASRCPVAEARAIAQAFVAEVARCLRSVVWLGAAESYSVAEMHVSPAEIRATVGSPENAQWADDESAGERYMSLAHVHASGVAVPVGPADDTLMMMRAEFRRFVVDRVAPLAQRIHRGDELIPMDLIRS